MAMLLLLFAKSRSARNFIGDSAGKAAAAIHRHWP